MVKTLEELRKKVLKNPENYGRFIFFDIKRKPICPVAIEIIPDYFDHYLSSDYYFSYAIKKLNCSERQLRAFTDWWDHLEIQEN